MAGVQLNIRCAGLINGEIVTVEGRGTGSKDRGTLGMHFEFSQIPEGFSVWCAALYTGCCSTPSFALEQDGGLNMLSLSGGRYRCIRTFDFGSFGKHDYNYQLRMLDDGVTMEARGVIQGDMTLPPIARLGDDGFTEVMIPTGPSEILAFSTTSFVTGSGDELAVRVESVYQPLDDTKEWHCCAKNQVRRSHIDIGIAEGNVLDLQYTTVIKGIDAPSPLEAAAAAIAAAQPR
jgi:hypothetical protein